MLEPVVPEIGCRRAGAIDIDDRTRERRETGAEVVLRLHAEQSDLVEIDAVQGEIAGIVRRLAALATAAHAIGSTWRETAPVRRQYRRRGYPSSSCPSPRSTRLIAFNLQAIGYRPLFRLLPQVILEMPVTEIIVSHLRGAIQHRHRNRR